MILGADTGCCFFWGGVSCVISSSLLCVVFTPDGSNQPFGPSPRGHSGRQLHHHWTEASGQFGEEVLPLSSNSRWVTEGPNSDLHLLPSLFSCSDVYVTMVKWATAEKLSVRWVNRAQNTSILSLCDVTTSACEKVRGRRADRTLWSCWRSSVRISLWCWFVSLQTSRNTSWHQTSGSIGWWVTDKDLTVTLNWKGSLFLNCHIRK